MSKLALRTGALSLFVAGAAASACSGGDSGDGGGGGGEAADAGTGGGGGGDGIDAGGSVDAGESPATCAVVADFGDLGAIDGEIYGDGVDYLSIDNTLDATAPVDLFIVELYSGFEPFPKEITTGTFEITGEQADYNTCGVCAVVFGDLDEGTGPGTIFTAQSGTVVVTSIDGNFTGSFTPAGETASFVGYTFSEAADEFVRNDDCTITGGGATWDKLIPVGDSQQ